MDKISQQRGRPPRSPIDRCRVKVWAMAVCYAARSNPRDLESALGDDGKWIGLWSRYRIGANSPNPDRLRRIDIVFEGTARYFESPLWRLLENREFSKKELEEYANWLQPEWRAFFVSPDDGRRFGSRHAIHERRSGFYTKAMRSAGARGQLLDVTTALLLCLREAEFIENGEAYLRAAQAWAWLQDVDDNFVIVMMKSLFHAVLEPLRHRRFYPEALDMQWKNHVHEMNWKQSYDMSRIDLANCLRRLDMSAI